MTTTPSTFFFAYRILPVLLIVGAMIAGCSSPTKHSNARGGGYYMDDGPGDNIPADIARIPDAVPRIEPHNPANFRPYSVMGQRFVPVSATTPLRQRGVASWYGRKFHGQKTANGETYDMYAMSAAHPTLPLPSYARVTHERSGRSVIVRVNDRGPFLRGRVIDLSYAAAAKLGIIGKGSDTVVVEHITHADIRRGLGNVAASPQPAAVRPAVAAAPETPRVTPAAAPPTVTPDALAVAPTPPATPQTLAPAAAPAASAASAPTPDALAALGPRAPTLSADTSDGIYLQFGAFGSYISADRLANRLSAEIQAVEGRRALVHSGGDLHRVRVGPYPDRTTAVNAAVRIQEITGMQPTLAQR